MIMPTLRRCAIVLGALMAVTGCATMSDWPRVPPERYDAVIASPVRTDQDRRMDASRKPGEFLPFTGVGPGMRVLDVSAGGGYTSQLLALAVGPDGRLYAQSPNPGATITQRLKDRPQANFIVVARPFEDPVPPEAAPLDLITLVLNYHDIAYLPVDRARMNARLFAALRPGGRLVIVDHAARLGTGTADTRTLHRIDETIVVQEVLKAGFVLDAQAEFLRNPADPRDKTTNDSPIATDRFVLRFVKPR
jgi:predicted methyltransferase